MTKNINWNFLNEWSAEKAWWLGILWGDGNVHSNEDTGNYKVSACGTEDTMAKWGKLITSDTKPQQFKRSTDTYQFGIYSKELVEWFKNTYEICGPKSSTLVWPHNLPKEFEKDFIRGLWDSDGSLFVTDPKQNNRKGNVTYGVKLTSQAKDFLEKIRQWFQKNFNTPETKVCEYDQGRGKNGISTYEIKFSGSTALTVAKALYENAPEHIRHKDKYEIYEWMVAFKEMLDNSVCSSCGEKPQFEGYCQKCWWDLKGRTTGDGTSCINHSNKKVLAENMCAACYSKKRRSDPNYVRPSMGICQCGKPAYRKMMCDSCYTKLYRASKK